MGNSFNISVKPEIAAVKAVVDANSVILVDVHNTDLPAAVTKIDANKTVIDENKVILADLHDTDIPALNTKLITVDAVVDNIRNIDVSNIQTNIDANETKIDTIDGIVDAIKTKTDATPQNVRGTVLSGRLLTTSAAFVDVINLTGHGILYNLYAGLSNVGDTIELHVIIDGKTSNVFTFTGSLIIQNLMPSYASPAFYFYISSRDLVDGDNNLFNLEFDTSLIVQIRRSAGSNDTVNGYVVYNLDAF